MTYSRHYPFLDQVHHDLGGDLARTVDFFAQVDKLKPVAAVVMKQRRIAREDGVEFIRANEQAVLDTATRALEERRAAATP